MADTLDILRRSGIQPTPQRIAVAEHVLATRAHPSADEVYANVKRTCPTVSRATVYNTLNLMVEKGLLRQQILREGIVVYDPHVARHHHFIDDTADHGDRTLGTSNPAPSETRRSWMIQ